MILYIKSSFDQWRSAEGQVVCARIPLAEPEDTGKIIQAGM